MSIRRKQEFSTFLVSVSFPHLWVYRRTGSGFRGCDCSCFAARFSRRDSGGDGTHREVKIFYIDRKDVEQ